MMKKFIVILSVTIIICLAFYFRTYEAHQVIFGDKEETHLLGIDPYFYLRHVETTYNNFPRLQKNDHSAHYPQGSYADASGLHVVILSGICRLLLGDSASSDEIASLIAWSSPIMSIVAFFLVFLIARELRNIETGILAGILLLLTPGKFYPRGLLGFVDHHIFEVVFSLALVFLLTRLFNLNKSGNKYLSSVLGGIFLSLFFTIWGGAALYIVLIFGVTVSFSILVDYTREESLLIAKRFILFYGIALIVFLSIYLLSPDLLVTASRSFNSDLIYILLGLMVITPAVIFGGSIKQRFNVVGIKLFSILIAGFVCVLITTQTSYGLTFLSYLNNAFSGIAENDPITNLSFLSYSGVIGILSYLAGLSYLVWAAFNNSRSSMIPIICFSLFFTFFWYQTFDLGYLVNPFMALITAVAIYDLGSFYIDEQRYRVPSLLLLTLLISFAPKALFPHSYPYNYSQNEIKEAIKYTPAHKKAMDWLRNNSPEPNISVDSIFSEELSGAALRDYGIMTSWDLGNLIIQRAKRKPVWSRWPSTKTSDWFNLTSEEEAISMINGSNPQYGTIKYVVIDADMASSFFIAKYQLSGNDLSDCLTQKEYSINGEVSVLGTLGSCYDSSMVNKLYRYPELAKDHFQLVYQSSEQSLLVTRHQNNGQLNLLNWQKKDLDQSLLDYLNNNSSFVSGTDIYTNCLLTPSIKIFKLRHDLGSISQ